MAAAGGLLMAFPLPLLHVLADGERHSGEALGERLGISRAGVWKQIQSLREAGLAIAAESGEGYQLDAPLDLLHADRLAEALSVACPELELIYVPMMDSTNRVARERAEQQGLARPVLVTTEYQTAGRGRRGRQWQGGFAQSLLLSVAVRLPCSAMQLGGLSLACGVALAEALQKFSVDVQLKWPNDLLLDGGKLGGLLIEIAGESDGPCDVVIGLGLNIQAPEPSDALDQPVSALASTGLGLSREELLLVLASSLLTVAQAYGEQGLAPWRQRWQGLNAHAEQWVAIEQGGQRQQGRCVGIDERGALLLATEQGERVFYAGDVSLRGAEQ